MATYDTYEIVPGKHDEYGHPIVRKHTYNLSDATKPKPITLDKLVMALLKKASSPMTI
jgi:hypothetical protein